MNFVIWTLETRDDGPGPFTQSVMREVPELWEKFAAACRAEGRMTHEEIRLGFPAEDRAEIEVVSEAA